MPLETVLHFKNNICGKSPIYKNILETKTCFVKTISRMSSINNHNTS